jgi:anti-sigma factor RsiW
MGHLSSVDFVDLLDGVRSQASEQHLSECDRCRRQFAGLREMMAAATSTDVPEPSPLFWEHLSARVQEAVTQEVPGTGEWSGRASLFGGWWIRAAAGVAVGALVIAAAVTLGSRPEVPRPLPPPANVQPNPAAPTTLQGLPDDGSFGLVADFGGTLEWDDLREQMAVSAQPGRLDGGVGELDSGERRELERLLKEELARPAVRTDRS